MFPKRIPISSWNFPLKPEIPKVLTFDAYNTLYATTLPVMEQYCLVAKKYGVEADPKLLTRNFPAVFKALKEEHPNYGKYTSISAREWWSHLIMSVFQPEAPPKEMIEEILERFEGFGAYVIYPDLLDLLRYIKKNHPNVILGIISNTDPIVYTLIKNLGLFDYFKDHFYLSYNLDVKKPSREIFEYALQDITQKKPELLEDTSMKELQKHCWHVGDEATNDMIGAANAGWNGVVIDRSNKYGYLSESFQSIDRSEDLLSVDKIDHNFQISWEKSISQMDTVQLSERTYVISNYKVLKSMLF